MFERVKGISISGRCFLEETELSFFPKDGDRIAVVYGKNGSGKSTISEGFSRIASGDIYGDLSVSLIDRSNTVVSLLPEGKVFVFDEKYIDENVKIDEDGLGTIILLGSQVDIQAEIDHYMQLLTSAEKEHTAAENKLADFAQKSSTISPEYHLSRIRKTLQGQWATIDSSIKGNKISSKVTEGIIKEIGELSVPENVAQLQQTFDETKSLLDKVADATESYPDPICVVPFADSFEENLCSLLAKVVEKPVLTKNESLILKLIKDGRQSFVEAAKRDFSNENTTFCPYCFRKIDAQYRQGLIDSIDRVLNKDVEKHKAELQAVSFPKISEDYSNFSELDAELVRKIHQQIKNCEMLIERYRSALEQKLSGIYNPLDIAPLGLNSSIRELNHLLRDLEHRRRAFVDAVRRRKTIVQDLILINKKIAHLQIQQMYRDYKKQIREKQIAQADLLDTQRRVGDIRNHLKELEQKKSDVGLAIESINSALEYVFFSRDRLSIELKDNKYYLKSNGKSVKPKNISLGERNIIALCYFFTEILSNQDIGKLYQDEELVVVDDPISSFDFENKVGISSFLRFQAQNIMGGNPSSKILFLTHDLSTFFDLQKIAGEIEQTFKKSDRPAKSNFFELSGRSLHICESKKKTYNEYRELLGMIFQYATGETEGLELTIGNAMRRSLEAFSTFVYGTGITGVSSDPKVVKSLGDRSVYFENLMYRLVLNGESHFQGRIYGVQDDLNFHQFISTEEKMRTCKDILCFMYCLYPDHIKSYFPKEAAQKIGNWAQELVKNDRFRLNGAQ